MILLMQIVLESYNNLNKDEILRCLKTVINPRSLISSSYADMLAGLFIIVKTKINYSCPTGFFSINKAAGVSA